MKVIFVRTYEMSIESEDAILALARDWREEGDDPVNTMEDALSLLSHAIDGGDLSSIAAHAGYAIVYSNPNIS